MLDAIWKTSIITENRLVDGVRLKSADYRGLPHPRTFMSATASTTSTTAMSDPLALPSKVDMEAAFFYPYDAIGNLALCHILLSLCLTENVSDVYSQPRNGKAIWGGRASRKGIRKGFSRNLL